MTARVLLVAALATMAADAGAQSRPGQTDLTIASLEDLLNIRITSASRKEQAVENTPAAVYVITQDDIRRSGMRLLPELFRLVPGMQVGQIGSSEWAVSIRGFNSRYSNKVLVLVDGRSIYNRAFTGVFWNSQEMMLDDIDRIEVIRGPGGAVWGADAVNGVINIITKSADATQGTLVRVGGSTFGGPQAAVRYGGRIGQAAYRVYSQWSNHQPAVLSDRDASAGDVWSNHTTGVRVDWTAGASAFLIEGVVIDSDTNPLVSGRTGTAAIPAANAPTSAWHNALFGRWTYTTGGGILQVQSFLNKNVSGPADAGPADRNSETIADVDAQYQRRFGARHDVVLGGGYRYASDYNIPVGQLLVDPASSVGTITNVFAQDEIALGTRISVTLGSKVERDSGSGWDAQPTARVLWDIGPSGQHVWAAVSHALRTPAPYDTSLQITAPLPPSPAGVPTSLAISANPDYPTEKFDDLEAGYRLSVGPRASFDVSAFRGRYDRLPSLHPLGVTLVPLPVPHLIVRQQFSNSVNADTSGVEIVGRLRPMARITIEASYSHLEITRTLDEGTGDTVNPNFSDASPANQWQLRTACVIGERIDIGGSLFHTGSIDALGIPANTRADLGEEVKLSRQLSLVVRGQNLLHAAHLEAVQNSLAPTRVPRSGSLYLAWRF